jgi:hypothetical protein
MNKRFGSYAVTALAAAGVIALLFSSTTLGQNANERAARARAAQNAAAAKPTPRMADGHPDLSGFYAGAAELGDPNEENGGHVVRKTEDGSVFFSYGGANTGGQAGLDGGNPAGGNAPVQAPPPYKPEYMAKHQKIVATVYGWVSHLDPFMNCRPSGVPRSGINGALEIIQNPKRVAILYENNPGPQYRIIYTDGRVHPPDYDTSFQGHSIGHWEGDTLVVDTVGLNDETWLGEPLTATVHSDKEHVIEKFTRKGDTLTLETTVEDPVMFTKPWVLPVRRAQIGPANDYIQPQACNTNDKDHIIEPSATDKYTCNWCQKDPDAVYGAGASSNPSTPGAKK